MEIDHSPDSAPWKVLGKSGEVKISVAPPTSIKVEVGGLTAILPLPIAVALQTAEAIAFLKNPAVVPFMWAASDRETRIRAARLIAQQGIGKKRRDLVAQFKSVGVHEAEAWTLARLQFPLDI